jgi:glycosyltransferase involved in cell wall biosynthesis
MIGFYPEYSKFSSETLRGGNRAERSALERCRLAIYTSDWAAEGAVRHYGVDPSKVRVVPLGANIAREPTSDDVARAIRGRSRRPWRLLFVGRDWKRKGGEVAVEVTVALNEAGFPARLTVVGCEPRLGDRARPHVEALGRLDTDRSSQRESLLTLLARSHFMILPTLADCTPVAISEANAFGVPCLTTAVGGIPTVLRDGVNGKLFPAATPAREYVAFITEVLTAPERYRALANSSFAEYEARLNWRVAGETVQRFLQEVV